MKNKKNPPLARKRSNADRIKQVHQRIDGITGEIHGLKEMFNIFIKVLRDKNVMDPKDLVQARAEIQTEREIRQIALGVAQSLVKPEDARQIAQNRGLDWSIIENRISEIRESLARKEAQEYDIQDGKDLGPADRRNDSDTGGSRNPADSGGGSKE